MSYERIGYRKRLAYFRFLKEREGTGWGLANGNRNTK